MENIKINFLHICENAFFAEDKKLNIIGIFQLINANGFPAFHPQFSIAFNVVGEIYGKGKKIEIISPNGVSIVSSEMENLRLEDKPEANLVVNFVGVVFPEPGAYKVIFKVDDKTISSDRQDFITVK